MGKYRIHVSDDHLKAIGLITIQFSRLEFTLLKTLGLLIDKDGTTSDIILGPMSFSRQLQLLVNLGTYKRPDLKDKLKDFAIRARTAEEKRNRIAHSFWGLSDDARRVVRYKIDASKHATTVMQTQEIAVKDLEEIADFIAQPQAAAFRTTMLLMSKLK